MFRTRPDDSEDLHEAESPPGGADAVIGHEVGEEEGTSLRPSGLPESVDRIFRSLDRLGEGISRIRGEITEL